MEERTSNTIGCYDGSINHLCMSCPHKDNENECYFARGIYNTKLIEHQVEE